MDSVYTKDENYYPKVFRKRTTLFNLKQDMFRE